jgi:hypothetical protein
VTDSHRAAASSHDPWLASVLVGLALAASGLGLLGFAWRGAARSLLVSEQLPFIASGAIGGVAIVGFACGYLAVQARRRLEARDRQDFERVLAAATELLTTARSS